jgi:hypothetical protein
MIDLVLVSFVGILCSLLIHAPLARRVYNLQLDVSTLKERLLQEKNSRASMSRKAVKESLEDLQTMYGPHPQPVRTVNPLAKFGIMK